MRFYLNFILKHRAWTLILFTIVTGLALNEFRYYKLSSGLDLLLGENPNYPRFLEWNEKFSSDGYAIAGFETPDPLAPQQIARVRRIVEGASKDPYTERVISLLSAQRIANKGDELRVEDYAALAERDPEQRSALLEELLRDPLYRDLILSGDGRYQLLAVESTAKDRSAETSMAEMELLRELFAREGFKEEEVHWTGNIAILAENLVQSLYNIDHITPAMAVILAVTIFLMFRRFWPVLLTLLITFSAITWTLALGIRIYGQLNFFSSLIPPLILITTFADVVHLSSAYLMEITHGVPKEEAIHNTGMEVGPACFYTAITSFIGFVSMAMTPTPVMRQLGFLLGFGIGIALIMALTLTPLFFTLFPAPRPWDSALAQPKGFTLNRVIQWAGELAVTHPWKVNIFFITALVLGLIGCSRITFETSFIDRLDKDNRIQRAARFFRQNFAGTSTLDFYITATEKEGLLDPALFAKIAAFQDELNAQPDISKALSVVDLVRRMNAAINPELNDPNAVPTTREGLAQLFLLFEMSGGRELERLLDAERKTLKITLRLKHDGVRAAYNLGQSVAALARDRLGSAVEVEPQGYLYLLGEWLDDLLAGQRSGLLTAAIAITISMAWVLRSFRMGLWSMLPNILPLFVVGGYAGFMWDTLDSDTLMAGEVAIGIAMDDTIHFLSRLKYEMSVTTDSLRAIRRTFSYCGRAMVISSVILVAGFLPFITSDHFTFHMLGTLLPISMIVAMLGDLFWVPALVQLGLFKFPRPANGQLSEGV